MHMLQDYLQVKNNGEVFVHLNGMKEDKSRAASRVAELEAFRNCPFQKGFAPDGLLCTEPPIPLQVVKYLTAQDLVNLSLVCKATHQAAHVLLQREVWSWSILVAKHVHIARPCAW